MASGLEVKGISQVSKRLQQASRNMRTELGKALFAEMLIEARESMRRTPVETGALRASHEVHEPEWGSDGKLRVQITVGGPAAGYALYVHENLDAHHPVGQAKFLESTLQESSRYMSQRVAKRLDMRKVMGR